MRCILIKERVCLRVWKLEWLGEANLTRIDIEGTSTVADITMGMRAVKDQRKSLADVVGEASC
jgi:hypothetical protein